MKRNQILRPDFSGIKNVEVKFVFIFLFNDLDGKRPFWIDIAFYGVFEVLSVEVWMNSVKTNTNTMLDAHTRVLTAYFKCLIPNKAIDT